MVVVGYLFGGNMLVCLLVKEGNDFLVDVVVIVFVLFMLEVCSYYMEKGFFCVYQCYLLNLLKVNVVCKLVVYFGMLLINFVQLKLVCCICEFDDFIIVRIYGYVDVIDYYCQCSVMLMLNWIVKLMLIIYVKDDLFMDYQVILKLESFFLQVEY